MSKAKLYGLRDQLSKFLYDPTPEQAAERTKQWEEGRFEESMETTKQVEEQLEYVEKQIEAVEAAEPELGEKIVTNTLLNMPWGRVGKFPGLGSLLGIAEEELEVTQMDRLAEIEHELSQTKNWESWRGLQLTDKELEARSDIYTKLLREKYGSDLDLEKKGIMSLLGMTPTAEEIERIMSMLPDQPTRTTYPVRGQKISESGTNWKSRGAIPVREETPISLDQAALEKLAEALKGASSIGDLAKSPVFAEKPLSDTALPVQTPTQEEEYQLYNDPVVSEGFAQRNPTAVNSPYDRSYLSKKLYPSRLFTLKMVNTSVHDPAALADLEKLSPEDAKEAETVLRRFIKHNEHASAREIDQRVKSGSVDKEIWKTEANYIKSKEENLEDWKRGLDPMLDLLNKKIKGYKSGGYIMNYGDYGRSYI